MLLSYDHCLDLAIRGPWGSTPPTPEEITSRADAYFKAQDQVKPGDLKPISDALGIDIGEIPPGPDVIAVVLARIAEIKDRLQGRNGDNAVLTSQVEELTRKLGKTELRLIAAETRDPETPDLNTTLCEPKFPAEYRDEVADELDADDGPCDGGEPAGTYVNRKTVITVETTTTSS